MIPWFQKETQTVETVQAEERVPYRISDNAEKGVKRNNSGSNR